MVCLEQAPSCVECLGETFPLPVPDIIHAVQECRKSKNLQYGRCIHMHLCHYGLEAHASVGNYLVPMLSECGSLENAKMAFRKLMCRNEHTWTSLIQGYLDCGEPKLALSLYYKMQEDHVYPTAHTFVPLLQSCRSLKCDTNGRELHSEIIWRGFENDVVLCNTLVDMYTECRMLSEAHKVFDHLPYKDIVSWNILIAGYAEQGLSEEAHALYKQMQMQGLQPDACTFVSILNACSNNRAIDRGQEIHVEIMKQGYEECMPVASKLVDFYAQCGLLEEAQEVFDQLSTKDVIVWTALIAGYADYGAVDEALSCYHHMQLDGVNPDKVTFVCILKACESTGDIDKCRETHTQLVKQEGSCDLVLGNTLVYIYAKSGQLADSRIEFEWLQDRNVVSWTALIAGYAEGGLDEEALEHFERMHLEGVAPNAATFTCIMQVCCNRSTISKGQMLHVEVVKKGFENDPSVCNIISSLYINFSLLQEAQVVFDTCEVHDVNSWNLLISGYAVHGLGDEMLVCLERMQTEDLSPSAAIYSCCLKYCASAQHIMLGSVFHVEVMKKGLEREPNVCSALMKLYAKCTSLAELEDLFFNFSEHDVFMWNILIQAYFEHGLHKEALSCLELMYMESVLPNIVSWNIIILGFIELGQSIKSLELYSQMQAQGLSPDGVMLVSIVKACSEVATLELGKRVHALSCQMDQLEDIELHNTLIDMYGKCGNMSLAQEAFDFNASKNLVSWNALLAGYARHGASELVFLYFDKMREQNVQPDEITFLSLLTACSHAGLFNKGQIFFEAITKECGLFPTMEHYTCIIDHHGRAGDVDEAMAMVEKVPSNLDLIFWDMMLGSCQQWANPSIGREALDFSVRLNENYPTTFILLSNMYANGYTCGDLKLTNSFAN